MHSAARERVALVDPHLRRALDAIDEATRGLTTEAWLRAAPGQWNSAQILEHLGKAYGSTAYILDKCVTDGAPKGRRPSWRQRVFATLIVELGYFPTGVSAPEISGQTGSRGPRPWRIRARRSRRSMPRPCGVRRSSGHASRWPITPSWAASPCASGDASVDHAPPHAADRATARLTAPASAPSLKVAPEGCLAPRGHIG